MTHTIESLAIQVIDHWKANPAVPESETFWGTMNPTYTADQEIVWVASNYSYLYWFAATCLDLSDTATTIELFKEAVLYTEVYRCSALSDEIDAMELDGVEWLSFMTALLTSAIIHRAYELCPDLPPM